LNEVIGDEQKGDGAKEQAKHSSGQILSGAIGRFFLFYFS